MRFLVLFFFLLSIAVVSQTRQVQYLAHNSFDAENKVTVVKYLEQNVPNPFNTSTEIYLFVPEAIKEAYVTFTDTNQHIVKKVIIKKRGKTRILLRANDFDIGTYEYVLYLDEIKIATKTMLVN